RGNLSVPTVGNLFSLSVSYSYTLTLYTIRKPFVPSERGASYIFNREALIDQLRRLKCRVLIRAHCPFEKGFTKSLDGFCYTVHSSKDPRRECYEAAMLLLDFNTETSLIEAQVVYHRADE
uniref:Uncharacterized protein n=1 Tax=Parascaris equorum TaxID=6256 RepID=A0A914RIG6_PAREQ